MKTYTNKEVEAILHRSTTHVNRLAKMHNIKRDATGHAIWTEQDVANCIANEGMWRYEIKPSDSLIVRVRKAQKEDLEGFAKRFNASEIRIRKWERSDPLAMRLRDLLIYSKLAGMSPEQFLAELLGEQCEAK